MSSAFGWAPHWCLCCDYQHAHLDGLRKKSYKDPNGLFKHFWRLIKSRFRSCSRQWAPSAIYCVFTEFVIYFSCSLSVYWSLFCLFVFVYLFFFFADNMLHRWIFSYMAVLDKHTGVLCLSQPQHTWSSYVLCGMAGILSAQLLVSCKISYSMLANSLLLKRHSPFLRWHYRQIYSKQQ